MPITLVDCGCEAIVYKDGSGIEIHYCPLHQAAKELLEALTVLVNYNENDPDLYKGDDDGILGKVMYKAHAAIARATSTASD